MFSIAIIIILIVFILFATNTASIYNNNVIGFYEGCDEFMEKSGLSEMYFYLAPDMKRGSLIIIDDENDTIENTTFTIKIAKKWYVSCYSYHAVFDCEILGTVFPKHIKISYSYQTGKLIIYDKKKIYGILIKDLKSTHQAFLAIKK